MDVTDDHLRLDRLLWGEVPDVSTTRALQRVERRARDRTFDGSLFAKSAGIGVERVGGRGPGRSDGMIGARSDKSVRCGADRLQGRPEQSNARRRCMPTASELSLFSRLHGAPTALPST